MLQFKGHLISANLPGLGCLGVSRLGIGLGEIDCTDVAYSSNERSWLTHWGYVKRFDVPVYSEKFMVK